MAEQWKSIPDYEGIYEVSNLGNVKSKKKNLILKPSANAKTGYLQVMLVRNSHYKMFYVHRLVAEAFIDNPNGDKCVTHLDKDKTNNKSDNLKWLSLAELAKIRRQKKEDNGSN